MFLNRRKADIWPTKSPQYIICRQQILIWVNGVRLILIVLLSIKRNNITGRAIAFHTDDSGLICSTSEHLHVHHQDWYLNTELKISPEHHCMWLQININSEHKDKSNFLQQYLISIDNTLWNVINHYSKYSKITSLVLNYIKRHTCPLGYTLFVIYNSSYKLCINIIYLKKVILRESKVILALKNKAIYSTFLKRKITW